MTCNFRSGRDMFLKFVRNVQNRNKLKVTKFQNHSICGYRELTKSVPPPPPHGRNRVKKQPLGDVQKENCSYFPRS